MEASDFKEFEALNDDINFWQTYTGSPRFSKVDVLAHSIKNDLCAIELKFRAKPAYWFMDKAVFIEKGKFENLVKESQTGKKALYLNFFEDGSAVLWKIDDTTEHGTTEVKIWNEGKNKSEYVTRYLLPIDGACAVFRKVGGKYTKTTVAELNDKR